MHDVEFVKITDSAKIACSLCARVSEGIHVEACRHCGAVLCEVCLKEQGVIFAHARCPVL